MVISSFIKSIIPDTNIDNDRSSFGLTIPSKKQAISLGLRCVTSYIPPLKSAIQTFELLTLASYLGSATAEDKDDLLHRKKRVINGEEVKDINEANFMAQYVDLSNPNSFCGGTIVSRNQILTAQHCVHHLDEATLQRDKCIINSNETHEVRHGSLNRFNMDSYKIQKIETYGEPCEVYLKNSQADFALITIEGKFPDSACQLSLPTNKQITSMKNNLIDAQNSRCAMPEFKAYGWGFIDSGDDELQANIYLPQKLSSVLLHGYKCDNETNMICAGSPREGRDTCHFDSGGPLLWSPGQKESMQYVGIVSSGADDICPSDSPSFYTNISHYKNWIESKLTQNNPLKHCNIKLKITDKTFPQKNCTNSDDPLKNNQQSLMMEDTTLQTSSLSGVIFATYIMAIPIAGYCIIAWGKGFIYGKRGKELLIYPYTMIENKLFNRDLRHSSISKEV